MVDVATIKQQVAEAFQQVASSTNLFAEKKDTNIHIYVVGDMMFDRAVRKQVQKFGFEYVFGNSITTFAAHDLVFGNLEGPITSSASKTLLPGGTQSQLLVFTFPTSTAPALKAMGMDVVSLANNHSQNFGSAGLKETKKLLNAQGIQYFGEPTNAGDVSTTTCIIKNDKKTCIGFVGYHEFTYQNESIVAKAIQDLRPNVDFLVVMPHWGNEYEPRYKQSQQQLAHQWIDLGADAVIGAHPHIITPLEIYKNKAIFYSLGNFIFDQYFSFDTTHGLTLSIDLSASSTIYKLIPIDNTGIRVKYTDATTTQKMLNSLATISKKSVSTSTFEQIRSGAVTLSR
jgi:poly-gamma-glutamate synthesis protein (capsule biosynthesis protein)